MPKTAHKNTHELVKHPSKLRDGIVAYLEQCRADGKTPHIVGLAVSLDIHRQRLSEWKARYAEDEWEGSPQAAVPDLLKKAEQACECGLLEKVINSNKPVGSMFVLKTHHGYIETEKIKHEHTGNVSIGIATGVPEPTAS